MVSFEIDCLVNIIGFSDETAVWEVYVDSNIKDCQCYSSDNLINSGVDQALLFTGWRKAEMIPTLEEAHKIGTLKKQLGKHRFDENKPCELFLATDIFPVFTKKQILILGQSVEPTEPSLHLPRLLDFWCVAR